MEVLGCLPSIYTPVGDELIITKQIELKMGNLCNASGGSVSASTPSLSGGQIGGIVGGTVGGFSFLISFITFTIMWIRYHRHKKELRRGKQKRDERDKKIEESKSRIPKKEKLTPEFRQKLLRARVVDLLAMLKAGQTTSVEILVCYYERALEMHQKYNFIVDVNWDEALDLATKYDELRKTKPALCKGALFGIPVSIKESFAQNKFPLTGGCISHLDYYPTQEATAVQLLRAEGAIPFIRTNVPQALYYCATNNNIWGETLNPWNQARNAGGSSGGEGAIVAARGSPLGLGSDAAGSLRIPAAFCGVYSFKPTEQRGTTKGHSQNGPSARGQINVRAVSGPIGICTPDLEVMCKALMSNKLYEMGPLSGDPYLPPLPWDDNKAKLEVGKKLKIGYVQSFDFFHASKTAKRAVSETISALKGQGHEVIEVKLPFFEDLLASQLKFIAGEGKARGIKEKLKNEKFHDMYVNLKTAVELDCCTRRVARCAMRCCGEKKKALILKNTAPLSAYEYLVNSYEQNNIRNKFFAIWEEHKLDAFIAPAYPIPAMKYKNAKFIGLVSCYSFFFNYLNLPTGSLPVTLVKQGEDIYDEKTGRKQEEIERKVRLDMAGSVGMPMSIQVATLPYQDEKCIAIMKIIEQEVPFYQSHKHPGF